MHLTSSIARVLLQVIGTKSPALRSIKGSGLLSTILTMARPKYTFVNDWLLH